MTKVPGPKPLSVELISSDSIESVFPQIVAFWQLNLLVIVTVSALILLNKNLHSLKSLEMDSLG
jgi:hypothetical protein